MKYMFIGFIKNLMILFKCIFTFTFSSRDIKDIAKEIVHYANDFLRVFLE